MNLQAELNSSERTPSDEYLQTTARFNVDKMNSILSPSQMNSILSPRDHQFKGLTNDAIMIEPLDTISDTDIASNVHYVEPMRASQLAMTE